MTKTGFDNYKWVDTGRGIAILFVIICHSVYNGKLAYFASFGRHGVQLFFILSSFTLCNSYEKRKKQDGINNVLFFYIRRFFRISPLYYLAALFYLIVNGINLINCKSFLASIFFVNQIYIPAFNNIPPGGWSIGTEMLFYLIFPFLIHLINTLRKAILFIIITVFISLVTNVIIIYYGLIDLFDISKILEFLFFNQLPVFAFGFLFYQIKKTKAWPYDLYNLSKIIMFSTLALIITVGSYNYLTLNLFLPILFSIFFVCFLINYSNNNSSNIIVFIVSEIGKVSFSMYLVHFIVIKIINYLLHPDYSQFMWASLLGIPLIITITFLISKKTTSVENWGIDFGKKIISTKS